MATAPEGGCPGVELLDDATQSNAGTAGASWILHRRGSLLQDGDSAGP
jgi:hypothetical protein